MKISTIYIFTLIQFVTSNRPRLSLMIRDGSFANIGGLDPSLSWSGSCRSGDIDLAYGIDAVALPTNDICSLPRSIWGKASTSFSGWDVSACAEISGKDLNNADVDIDAVNDDLSLHFEASTGNGFNVHRVEATKTFEEDGCRVIVNPRYNVDTEESDFVLGYSKGKTDIRVNTSNKEQVMTLSHQLDNDNRISPTLTSTGNMRLEWEHRLGENNSVTATLRPNESVDIEWKDSSWTADINLPIDSTNSNRANVRIKREVNF